MPYQSVDETIAQKTDIKKRLLKKIGKTFSSSRPLISIVMDGEFSKEDFQILRFFNEGVKDLGADFVILSESAFDGLSNFDFIEYNLGNRELIFEASDLMIAFDFNDIEEMMMQGCVPVCKKREEAENYNAQNEKGNAFVYKNTNAFSLFEACVRAIESYKFPWDFKHIIKSGIKRKELL